jgi:hypothetical protein
MVQNAARSQFQKMAQQFSMLGIMNAALITEGFDEIVSLNDGSDEWRILSRNWPLIVEAELEDGLYSFTRREAELLSRQPGKFGFEDGYLVPNDALHVRRVWTEDDQGTRDTAIDWGQDGNCVYVNNPSGIFVEYMEAADPSFWGANFSRGVQMKLQAVLLNVKEEQSAARNKEQEAEVYFQRARTQSSKSRSAAAPYVESRFARARFRRG